MATKREAAEAVNQLRPFISKGQLQILGAACYGEDRQFFIDKIVEYGARVNDMPKVYDQDGLGDNAIAYLHYFRGGFDAYVTERDTSRDQHQAFGLINLGFGYDLGYISIQELIDNNFELDLHFEPTPLKDLDLDR